MRRTSATLAVILALVSGQASAQSAATISATPVARVNFDPYDCSPVNQTSTITPSPLARGYDDYENFSAVDGAVFDARGFVVRQQSVPYRADQTNGGSIYVVDIRSTAAGNVFCWKGGLVVNTSVWNSWAESKGQIPPASVGFNSACFIFKNGNVVAVGLRGHHCHDFFRPWDQAEGDLEYFTLKNSWASDVWDDCIEADSFNHGGLIEGNLFDGCFRFYSNTSADVSAYTVTFRDNVIRMGRIPQPAGDHGNATCGPDGTGSAPFDLPAATDCQGHGGMMKGDYSSGPNLEWFYNDILIEFVPSSGSSSWSSWVANIAANVGIDPSDKTTACKGNTIWLGPDWPTTAEYFETNYASAFPSNSTFPGCWKVIKLDDLTAWNNIVERKKAQLAAVQRVGGVD